MNSQKPIGVLGFCSGLNYGSHLTNYATYLFLKENGYSSLMIDINTNTSIGNTCPLFYDLPYKETEVFPRTRSKIALKSANELCDVFLSTSDQQLHALVYNITGKTAALDWITKNKKIIAYAASWGNDFFTGTEYERAEMSYFLKQIDFFSVREKSAVKLAEQEFGLKPQFVIDPVFLCNPAVYEKLAEKARIKPESNKYVLCYILDDLPQLDSFLEKLRSQMNMDVIFQNDADMDIGEKLRKRQSILGERHIEDWLYSIKNCEFYVTDSFHGSCIGIIMKKQFVVILNDRGSARVYSIMEALGLESRIARNVEEAKEIMDKGELIDYEMVFKKLEHLKQKSARWLLYALERPLPNKSLSTYDICDARVDALSSEIASLRHQINELRGIVEKASLKLHINQKETQFEQTAAEVFAPDVEAVPSSSAHLTPSNSEQMLHELKKVPNDTETSKCMGAINQALNIRRKLSRKIAYPVRDFFRTLRKRVCEK